MKLRALFNAVIVEQIEEEESTYGSIVVPDMGKEKTLKGKIISVGPGQYTAMGNLIEPTVKVGDVIIMPQMGPTVLNHGSDEYLVCKENEILAIIEE
jgi:chaperonin GroES|tara:strand:+ start:2387 stop:2677 length:291 start_codon:yes stop_codon:yes gene_type:complete